MKEARTVKKLTDLKWMNLYETVEEEKGVTGFQYAERRGIDSVAFIVWHKDKKKFLLTKEYLPPVGHFLTRAFGGSLDKDMELKEIVKLETLEECGYKVELNNILYVGKSFVSSMMNQYCHLFLVTVSESQFSGREPENKTESLSEVIELTEDEIMELDDWKSITIVSKLSFNLY